ncbi:capsular exopolysaccharide family [Peptoclostridium litorale DSM 5388]|uniref:non-specific protein-tyrosine kinase n=1 Tax=Peptoclostridium litorale DSM 5388 TaxID=1121324 RepID=A0A069RC75_PEPLI|nr:polysaccharide biosynthesis tyrosine autokinase [Peptoclostridium litorale]KDR94601.1 capsular exopolysaccharide family [Peptoclostridium litorale DSM 5388]SIO31971.1 capsular exopolysaccharide family [Peptoclostridium litorale DSM 5388]
MNGKKYIGIFKRRKWLFFMVLAVSVAVSAVMTFYVSEPEYSSYTTLMVNKARGDNENYIDYESYIISQKLVDTYAVVAKSETVMERTIKNLNLRVSPQKLLKKVKIDQVDETEVLKISASSTDPALAAAIANEIAQVFKEEIFRIMNDENVRVIDYAKIPAVPSKPDKILNMAAGVFFGIMGGLLVVYVLEYFDNAVRSAEDIQNGIGISVIGSVPKLKMSGEKGAELVIKTSPKSPGAEAFRSIRTNMQFANIDQNIKTILFTSSIPGEGKTLVSANMATALCGIGKKVMLFDCDFRKPRLAKVFGLSNTVGITDALMSKRDYREFVKETHIENLHIMTAGNSVQNPAELLQSERIRELIRKIENDYDYIIVDTPPATAVTDASIVSTFSDAAVIVCSSGIVDIDELKRAKAQLEGVNARIMGAIFNRASEASSYYSYYGK